MLLVTIPLSQLPPEIIARLSIIPDAPAAERTPQSERTTEPSRRLLITGDESGRVKIWDADAIITLCNLPTLSEIVALALETAKVGYIIYFRGRRACLYHVSPPP